MDNPFGPGFDPGAFRHVPLFRELFKAMSWTGGPVNWELAAETATSIVTDAAGDERSDDRASDELAEAVSVAELWLDAATGLAAVEGTVRAYTQLEWAAQAAHSSALGVYVEPVAEGMASALTQQLPDEVKGLLGAQGNAALLGPMASMGAMLYGVQVGQITGHLAGQLLGTYDLGVPTLAPNAIGAVGGTARRFATDYDFDQTEFRYWLALREATHRRMFAGVPWLRPRVAALIGRFALEADFDPNRLFEQLGGIGAMGGIDPDNPEALRELLAGEGGFSLEPTTAQRATLAQLQAIVAFVEAYSDTVVRSAAAGKLPALGRIEEAVTRRRAAKGPGERFLEQLIGLDLKPADFRQAGAFCAAVIAARGQSGLDRVWHDAAHLPTPEELSEPSRWLVRMAAVELEAGVTPELDEQDAHDDEDDQA